MSELQTNEGQNQSEPIQGEKCAKGATITGSHNWSFTMDVPTHVMSYCNSVMAVARMEMIAMGRNHADADMMVRAHAAVAMMIEPPPEAWLADFQERLGVLEAIVFADDDDDVDDYRPAVKSPSETAPGPSGPQGVTPAAGPQS